MLLFEKLWVIFFCFAIAATTIVFSVSGTNWTSEESIILNWIVGPLSAITGVVCVVLCAKGHISNYLWGIINAVTYGYVAWKSGYYGDWILNWFFFLPTQFFIWFCWKDRLCNKETEIVKMQRLNITQILQLALVGLVALTVFGLFLQGVDNWFTGAMKRNVSIYKTLDTAFHIPYLGAMFDSSTEILQIIAQILLIKRYAEQWPLWFMTNIISIIMWGAVICVDPTSIPYALPTLIMWIAFLINSIYGCAIWYRESEKSYLRKDNKGK